MHIKTLLWIFPCVVALGAAACGDDPSATSTGGGGDDGQAGDSPQAGDSSGGGSLNTGGGNSSDAGATMTPEGGSATAMAGAPASAGEATGGSGSAVGGAGGSDGGNGLDPQSTACSDFPETVALGETIGLGQKGAVLCYHAATEACRLTTNTYSDGENPCPNGDDILFFAETANNNTVNLPQGWEFVSASDGMLNQGAKNFLNLVPEDTEITAVIKSPTNDEYTVVFTFDGAGQFTITSFAPN